MCKWYFTKKVCRAASIQLVLEKLPKVIPWEGALVSALDFILAPEGLAGVSCWPKHPPSNLSASWKAMELKYLGHSLKVWGSRGVWGCCLVCSYLLEVVTSRAASRFCGLRLFCCFLSHSCKSWVVPPLYAPSSSYLTLDKFLR